MTITIDWDNYEVIESEDFTEAELDATIEDVREAMDCFSETTGVSPEDIPEVIAQLLDTLVELEKEIKQ